MVISWSSRFVPLFLVNCHASLISGHSSFFGTNKRILGYFSRKGWKWCQMIHSSVRSVLTSELWNNFFYSAFTTFTGSLKILRRLINEFHYGIIEGLFHCSWSSFMHLLLMGTQVLLALIKGFWGFFLKRNEEWCRTIHSLVQSMLMSELWNNFSCGAFTSFTGSLKNLGGLVNRFHCGIIEGDRFWYHPSCDRPIN